MPNEHDLADWAEAITVGRRLYNVRYRPMFPGWEQLKARTIPVGGKRKETWLLFERDRVQIRVDVTEATGWRDAQVRLAEYLDDCMRPDIAVTAGDDEESGMGYGDVRFVSMENDRLAAATFARGNVCIRLSTVSRDIVDLVPFAELVDNDLLGNGERSRDRIRRRGSIVNLDDLASNGDGWLTIVAESGEIGANDNGTFRISGTDRPSWDVIVR